MPRDGGENGPEKAPWTRTDPDGRFRYFDEWTESGARIEREPVGGGTVETIAEAAWETFAVTRQGIYFTVGPSRWQPTHIAFLDFATRRQTKVVDLPRTGYSGRGLSLSPDGRWLVYTRCGRETDDLMLVENFR